VFIGCFGAAEFFLILGLITRDESSLISFLISIFAGILAAIFIRRNNLKKQKPDPNPGEEEYQ
jgi:dolichol kinase